MKQEIYLEIGEKIRILRLRKGMSRKELAEKAGISVFTVGCYERGERKPSFVNMELISAVLGVSLDEMSIVLTPRGRNESK